jgi:hypothetical protein
MNHFHDKIGKWIIFVFWRLEEAKRAKREKRDESIQKIQIIFQTDHESDSSHFFHGQNNLFISKIGKKSTFQMKVLLPQSIEENTMSENMIGKIGMMKNSENK